MKAKSIITFLTVMAVLAGSAIAKDLSEEKRILPGISSDTGQVQMSATTMPQVSKGLQTKRIQTKMPEGGYTLPALFQPTSEQFGECTVIDANTDGKTWSFDSPSHFKFSYSSKFAGDDWLILPAVKTDGAPVKVSFEYFSKSASYPEKFEVWAGTTPNHSEMTKLYENLSVTNPEPAKAEVIAAMGGAELYVAFHAISEPNMFYLYLQNVQMNALELNAPGLPTNLQATMSGQECTLSFCLPESTLGGTPYDPGSQVGASILVDGVEKPTETPLTGNPGSLITTSITLALGDHTIGVRSWIDDADGIRKYSDPISVNVRATKVYEIPMQLPVAFTPDQDEFNLCTIVNNNNDNNTWAYATTGNSGNRPSFRYSYSWLADADDWLILPEIKGDASGIYDLTFDVDTKFDNERLKVYVGTSASLDDLAANCIYDSGEFKTSDVWQTRSQRFSVAPGQNFFVAFQAASPKSRSYIYLSNISVSIVDPKLPKPVVAAPFDLDGGNGTLSFILPSQSVDGQTLTATELTLELTLDNNPTQTATGTPGATLSIPVADLSLGTHTYSVRAGVAGTDNQTKWSELLTGSFNVTLPQSFAYDLPVSMPMNGTDKDTYIIVDGNTDNTTWAYSASDNCFKYSYNSSNPGDDWIITPAINITDVTSLFRLGLDIRTGSGAEGIEVYLGTERNVESMTTLVMQKELTGVPAFKNYILDFTLPSAGKYYIGIRCVSAKNAYGLYVRNLSLASTGISPKVPGVVGSLQAVADQTGANQASLSFVLPTIDMTGQPLDGQASLTATATCGQANATASGLPGQELSMTVDTQTGDNTITVVVSNAYGNGASTSVNVKCGLDRPKTPILTAAEESEDNMSITLRWQPVTEGITGGAVNAPAMRYRIYEYDLNDDDWYLIEDVADCYYTYTVATNTPQDIIVLGVDAYNAPNSGSGMNTVNVNIGTPLTMPIEENFANGKFHFNPVGLTSSLSADVAPKWSLVKPENVIEGANSPSGYAIVGRTDMNRGDSRIMLPRFSTIDYDIVNVSVPIYCHANSAQVSVYAYGLGMTQALKLGEASPRKAGGWESFPFVLPQELLGKKWVQLYLYVNFANGSSDIALIGGYDISGEKAVSKARAYQMGDEKGRFGFVEFDVDKYSQRTIVKATSPGGTHISAGEGVNGIYYAYSVEADPFGAIYAANFETYNLSDFSLVSSTPNAKARRVVDMTYDYSTNTLFALVEDNEETGKIGRTSLNIVNPATGEYTRVGGAGDITAIDGYGRTIETVLLTLAADKEGQLYAMSDHRQFYSVDKYSGAATQIGEQHLMATDNTFQSMAFDNENTLYWTQQHPDYSRFLTIDKTTGVPTHIADLEDNPQISGLFFDKPFDTSAPSVPTNFTATLGATAPNRVTLTWTLPTVDCAGQPVAVTAVKVFRLGSSEPLAALPGDAVTFVDENAPNGEVSYLLTTVSNKISGQPAITSVIAGNDVVSAPTDLTVTMDGLNGQATWAAPTSTENGRYADFSAIVYDVDLLLGTSPTRLAEGISETSLQFTVNKGGTYTLRVTPSVGGVEGISATSEPFTVDISFAVPYTSGFEDNQDGTLWTTVRGAHHVANNYGWSITAGTSSQRYDGKFAQLSTGGSAEYADDWLISPPIRFEAGMYELSYLVTNSVSSDKQSWSTLLGTDPADLTTFTTTIASYSDWKVPSAWVTTQTEQIKVKDAGIYHLAFHGMTKEMYANLRIDNVKIESSQSDITPVSAVNMYVYDGKLYANAGIWSYTILRATGQIVDTANDLSGENCVSLGNLPAGVYFVTATLSDGTIASHKFMVR